MKIYQVYNHGLLSNKWTVDIIEVDSVHSFTVYPRRTISWGSAREELYLEAIFTGEKDFLCFWRARHADKLAALQNKIGGKDE